MARGCGGLVSSFGLPERSEGAHAEKQIKSTGSVVKFRKASTSSFYKLTHHIHQRIILVKSDQPLPNAIKWHQEVDY